MNQPQYKASFTDEVNGVYEGTSDLYFNKPVTQDEAKQAAKDYLNEHPQLSGVRIDFDDWQEYQEDTHQIIDTVSHHIAQE